MGEAKDELDMIKDSSNELCGTMTNAIKVSPSAREDEWDGYNSQQ